MNLLNVISKFFTGGHQRTQKAKKNVVFSFIIKGCNILLGILILPVTLGYLGDTRYGIWLTVGSLIDWFAFFDIGLSSGLRNKLAMALSKNNFKRAQVYISTSYAMLIIISLSVYVVFFVAQHFIVWHKVFNTSPGLEVEIRSLIQIAFTFFCLKFILQLLNSILLAHQRPATRDFLQLLSKIISSLVIVVLAYTTTGSLVHVSYAYSLVPVIMLGIATVYLFRSKFSNYIPSFRSIRFKYIKDLMNLGMKFFVINIAVLVMFTTGNMILTQLYGPEAVPPYNIAYRYFGIFTMGFSIIVSPIWSAVTEAYTKGDITWIKNIVKKLNWIWLLGTVGVIVMLIVSPFIYKLWIGDKVHVPLILSCFMAFHVIFQSYGSVYVNVLNGMGKVKIQYYTAIFSAIVNIPLSIFFSKFCDLGPAGVILATTVCVAFGPLIAPVQYKKIINKTAKGIWNE